MDEANEVRLDSLRPGAEFTLVLSTGKRIPGSVRYLSRAGVAVQIRPEHEWREAEVTGRDGQKRIIRLPVGKRIEHWSSSTPVVPAAPAHEIPTPGEEDAIADMASAAREEREGQA